MKIAVLGARGFVGRNIAEHFLHNHTVIPVTRDTLDLLNSQSVKSFLKREKFDVIVNCASTMTDDYSVIDARNNLGMFMNFYHNSDLFGKFINTGSGAEFDRTTNIENALEDQIFDCVPKDSYGWGQNVKARLCARTDKFYNIRIFNCFGMGEIPTRIFPRFLKQGSLEISNDRYFDYFSVQDLKRVVEHCIDNNWTVKDVNAVYEHKIKISQALQLFCETRNLDSNFTVLSESSNNYTGSGLLLKTLQIKLDGLEQGFKEYI